MTIRSTFVLFWLLTAYIGGAIALGLEPSPRLVTFPSGATEKYVGARGVENGLCRMYEYRNEQNEVVARRYFYQATDANDQRVLAIEETLERELLHGVRRVFHPNGTRFAEIPYWHGRVHGEVRYWGEDEREIGTSMLVDGTGLWTSYGVGAYMHSRRVEAYRNGVRSGPAIEYDGYVDLAMGRIAVHTTLGQYRDGRKNGVFITYGDEGRLLRMSSFLAGALHGVFLRLEADGKTVKEGSPIFYLEGEKVSEERFRKAAAEDENLMENLRQVLAE